MTKASTKAASAGKDLMALERRFWQSMVDEDTDTALDMLAEPSLMVSEHGAMSFDHAGYRKMAEQGAMIIKSFELDDMQVAFPNDDTAILTYGVKQVIAMRDDEGEAGEDIEQQMTDSSVWQRQADGHWRCVMHTETPAAQHKGAH